MTRGRLVWILLFGLALAVMAGVVGILVLAFSLGGMARVTAWYLFQIVPPILGVLTLFLVLACAVFTRSLSPLAVITGVVSLAAITPALLMLFPITYPASVEKMTPSATVRLPADIPLKVGWGGDSLKVNAHAFVPDQRWAYDFLAEPFGQGAELTDYGIYGVPVVAPAAGEIVAAHDGEPDAKPGVLSHNYEAPLGNYIAIRLPTNTYLLIAHLKPGSVSVRAGDLVAEGQKIGECGNSGNTSEPHIHIHHQRQNPLKYPVNFAEGLPLFFRDHDGPAMPAGGFRMENGKPVFTGPTVRHLGR